MHFLGTCEKRTAVQWQLSKNNVLLPQEISEFGIAQQFFFSQDPRSALTWISSHAWDFGFESLSDEVWVWSKHAIALVSRSGVLREDSLDKHKTAELQDGRKIIPERKSRKDDKT